jgi:extradiol dioxygenase family protein
MRAEHIEFLVVDIRFRGQTGEQATMFLFVPK